MPGVPRTAAGRTHRAGRHRRRRAVRRVLAVGRREAAGGRARTAACATRRRGRSGPRDRAGRVGSALPPAPQARVARLSRIRCAGRRASRRSCSRSSRAGARRAARSPASDRLRCAHAPPAGLPRIPAGAARHAARRLPAEHHRAARLEQPHRYRPGEPAQGSSTRWSCRPAGPPHDPRLCGLPAARRAAVAVSHRHHPGRHGTRRRTSRRIRGSAATSCSCATTSRQRRGSDARLSARRTQPGRGEVASTYTHAATPDSSTTRSRRYASTS